MLEVELYAENLMREREGYFASPQFKARSDWQSGLLAKLRHPRRAATQRQRAEAQREPAAMY